ncbi:hypothetical protein [Embleya sp. NPDC020630]|uniref:hypothetical protein n=1 Tax=Embleya sp. NPDC020630 TaxID=3363979 RepID=UPI0037BCE2A7
MDLGARYRGLYEAGLFIAESAEDAYPLGALDAVLHASIRSELGARENSIDHCDSRMDVADAAEGLAAIAPPYAKLRRELFSDLHHVGRPAARWRAVSRNLAVLAPLQVWRRPPAYALLLRDPGVATGGAESWDFIVYPRASDPRVPGTTYTAMVFPDAASTPGTVQVTRQLEEQHEHYEQLTYGFTALGRLVQFAALNHPDGGREPQAPMD